MRYMNSQKSQQVQRKTQNNGIGGTWWWQRSCRECAWWWLAHACNRNGVWASGKQVERPVKRWWERETAR